MLRSIIKHKKIFLFCIVLGIVSGVVANFVIPPVYESYTEIIPNFSEGISKSFLSSMLGFQGAGTPFQIVMALLKSEKMYEDAVRDLNLVKYYGVKDEYKAKKRLKSSVKIKFKFAEGVILIKVKDKNPEMASKIANYMVKHLEDMNKQLKITTLNPLVIVLTKAKPIYKKKFPKLYITLPISLFIFLLGSIFLIYFIEYFKNLENLK